MAQINLPADLPENLEHGQIIAPNGSDIGQPEQYGYNYLMKQVNAAQRAINENIENSETVESIQRELAAINSTLTHTAKKEDIQIHNTSTTSHEDIRLQLQTQATKIKLLEDMLATDIQQNQTVIMFMDLSGIRLKKGVYNEEQARIEC